jgi:hypothetical protein
MSEYTSVLAQNMLSLYFVHSSLLIFYMNAPHLTTALNMDADGWLEDLVVLAANDGNSYEYKVHPAQQRYYVVVNNEWTVPRIFPINGQTFEVKGVTYSVQLPEVSETSSYVRESCSTANTTREDRCRKAPRDSWRIREQADWSL